MQQIQVKHTQVIQLPQIQTERPEAAKGIRNIIHPRFIIPHSKVRGIRPIMSNRETVNR